MVYYPNQVPKLLVAFITVHVLLAAYAAHASVGEPNVTWTNKKVHVCWNSSDEKTDFKVDQKKAVQTIVEEQYTEARTGITFFGWEECSTLPAHGYDVQIFQDNDSHERAKSGESVIGQGGEIRMIKIENPATHDLKLAEGFFQRDLKTPYVYLVYRQQFSALLDEFTAEQDLQVTALHEFGHVAGLRHETLLSEAIADENCKYFFKARTSVEAMLDSAKIYETYDSKSIMNTCWISTLEFTYKTAHLQIELSEKDLSTLKKLYSVQN